MPNGGHHPNFWIKIGLIIAAIGVIVAIIALLVPVPQLPTAPIFEGGGEIDTDGNYEISWGSSKRAITYILEESGDISFTSPTIVYRGDETKKFNYGKHDGDYYYRVRACNDAGESVWSSSRRIRVSISLPTGSITVTSSPSGASIYLDDGYRGDTPQTIAEVPLGTHTIELRLEGYEDWSRSVQVTAGETTYVDATLIHIPTEPSTGTVTVASSPSDASIYLDDGYRGDTPQTIAEVPLGTHTIELRLEGYEDWSRSVQVTAGETSYVDATMTPIPTEPSTGNITVSSSPAGASIYLDSEYMGNTPQTITAVSQGTHTIELRSESYEVLSESVEVMAGETTYVDAPLTPISTEPPTEPSTGAITVSSSPAGASIYLNGEYMGNTPQTITALSPGTHTIELRLAGYEDWSESVQLTAGETTYVDATLTPISTEPPTEPSTGAITVSSSPAGASIYVDSEYMGNTPQTITAVSQGTHTIELRSESYEVLSESVQLTAGETTYVDATLTPTTTVPPTPIPTPVSINLTYNDFDYDDYDVCTFEDNFCGWASVPGKAVVYGSMIKSDIHVPEGASELEVTISIFCNGVGEGLSGPPGSAAYIRVDSEEREEMIDSTMISHQGNYYKYESCDTFSNTFNVRGKEEITLIIEMSGGAHLDFKKAILTFS